VFNQFRQFQYSFVNTNQTTNFVLFYYFAPPFNQLPLLRLPVTETNFIYCDITLLNVRVAFTNGAREIAWRSVSNRVNKVEYTTNFPPAWLTLFTTNGNGSAMKFTDASPGKPSRFYRVRVDY
jgi:hypothetical protein